MVLVLRKSSLFSLASLSSLIEQLSIGQSYSVLSYSIDCLIQLRQALCLHGSKYGTLFTYESKGSPHETQENGSCSSHLSTRFLSLSVSGGVG